MTTETPLASHTAAPLHPGDLLTETEAAAILGCAVQTLRNWRWRGNGVRAIKVGKRMVRYSRADLAAFIEAGDAGKADAARTPQARNPTLAGVGLRNLLRLGKASAIRMIPHWQQAFRSFRPANCPANNPLLFRLVNTCCA